MPYSPPSLRPFFAAHLSLTICLLLLPQLKAAQVPAHQIFTDYAEAKKNATEKNELLLVVFYPKDQKAKTIDHFAKLQKEIDRSPKSMPAVTSVFLPTDHLTQTQKEVSKKRPKILLKTEPFTHLHQKPGLAILDFRNAKSSTYEKTISIYPFQKGLPSDEHFKTLLLLPDGTLTQRTLVFAVRIHPENPRSTSGEPLEVLFDGAEKHSNHQARIRLQGHHNWNRRFHEFNASLPPGMLAQEVCAESWPGEDLYTAALECVSSWRQSSGHWEAVRGQQKYFGYDMKRGSNGIWYATGIFAKRGTP
ncbi:MAG: hypothetical protein MPJ24_00740 [Pirellulaceae bacterium]|nr:hypothetical protein [Pirellulaceae bacterium]